MVIYQDGFKFFIINLPDYRAPACLFGQGKVVIASIPKGGLIGGLKDLFQGNFVIMNTARALPYVALILNKTCWAFTISMNRDKKAHVCPTARPSVRKQPFSLFPD